MQSLPTIEAANKDTFMEVLRKFNPELYLIQMALNESGVNPLIVPKIIRSIGNLCLGTGFGKIQIFIQNNRITQLKGEESVYVEEEATII